MEDFAMRGHLVLWFLVVGWLGYGLVAYFH
jgi:hypothetical protein